MGMFLSLTYLTDTLQIRYIWYSKTKEWHPTVHYTSNNITKWNYLPMPQVQQRSSYM